MVRIFALSFSLLLFCGFQKPEPSLLGIQLNYEKKKLSNGLTVLLVEDHTSPLISYQTFYKVGSVDESQGMSGISHLFEHLMFKGTPRYGPRRFFEEFESKGSEVNAFTTRDYTVFYETFTSNLLEKAVELESDRMANLNLTEEVLENVKRVAFEERRLKLDLVPDNKIQEAIWQLAFRYHPYQRPVMGYPLEVLQITLSQLKDYFKSYYQPANAVVVLVGDFKTDEAFQLLKKSYEKIPSSPRPKRVVSVEPPQGEEHRLILRDQVSSEKLVVAYHSCAGDDPDVYALDIASNILFQGPSSRARQGLVEERELFSAINGSNFTPTYPGLFIVAGTVKGKRSASEAETELFKLIAEFKEKGVTQDEIRVAVKQLTVQAVDGIRTPHSLGQMIGMVEVIFGDPHRFVEDFAKYAEVTPADVKRVVQKYFDPNNRVVVTLVPK